MTIYLVLLFLEPNAKLGTFEKVVGLGYVFGASREMSA
jgi:hypothetical protein